MKIKKLRKLTPEEWVCGNCLFAKEINNQLYCFVGATCFRREDTRVFGDTHGCPSFEWRWPPNDPKKNNERRDELCEKIDVEDVIRYAEKLGFEVVRGGPFISLNSINSGCRLVWPVDAVERDGLKTVVVGALARRSGVKVDDLIAIFLAKGNR